jgi:hypothetical protein
MMDNDTRVRANDREIAAKVVDGEAILINLASGLYYSMDRTGAVAWSLLAAGSSVDGITAHLAARHGMSADSIRADIRRLVDELLSEGLVVVDPAGTPGTGSPLAAPGDSADAPYEAPRLVKFDDMADIFALDPPLPELAPVPNEPGGKKP